MLNGVVGSPGAALGTVVRWQHPPGSRATRSPLSISEERKALRAACDVVAADLDGAAGGAGEDTERDILHAQAAMASDPELLRAADRLVAEEGMDAATAFRRAAEKLTDELSSSTSERIRARTADLGEVARLVVSELSPGTPAAGPTLPEHAVIVATDLGPAETAKLDRSRVCAFVLERSSPTAHTAILARTYGVPAVVQVGSGVEVLRDGMTVAVDGDAGAVHVDPDAELVAEIRARIAEQERRREQRAGRTGPALLKDGRSIELAANVGSGEQARAAAGQGARRIGLFRTEFLFMERPDLPTEAEQEAEYRAAIEAMDGGRVVLRTLDVGGDKPLPTLESAMEANPMLGRRGLRLGLHHPELLGVQLRAMLRSSEAGPVGIMFPMIADIGEVRDARALLERCRHELASEGVAIGDDVLIGIMVETPAAVLTADVLGEVVDFFSIGTNDLLQYTFAADRDNTEVSGMLDPLHPALLRAVRLVVDGAARNGVPVTVCGEAAGDPLAQLLLVGLGVDELSMVAPALSDTRENLARWSSEELTELAEHATTQRTAADVRALLQADPTADAAMAAEGRVTTRLTIGNPEGLHARPANEVSELVHRHASQVTIRLGDRTADAASVLSLLTLGADTGDTIIMSAEGSDARALTDELARLLGG
jgi:phosphoenolpyruvate-protein phosphotransferase (PTS system enzyme I)